MVKIPGDSGGIRIQVTRLQICTVQNIIGLEMSDKLKILGRSKEV